MTFNHHLIRETINATGLPVGELAFRVDISLGALNRILDGEDDPGDIRIGTLKRLADHLGLPVQALLAPPEIPEPDESVLADDVASDAATVTATIYDRGATPTINTDLATALNWDLDRLHNAYKEADRRLRPAGLRLTRAHGEASIVPLQDTSTARRNLDQVHAANKGLDLAYYKPVHALLNGQPWRESSGYKPRRRRFVAGALINHGILTGDRSDPTLTEAVLYGDPTNDHGDG